MLNRLPYAVDETIPIDQIPPFFEGAKLNFAENILQGPDDDVAVISATEESLFSPERYTWRELRDTVAAYGSRLCKTGVKRGNVVACELRGIRVDVEPRVRHNIESHFDTACYSDWW